MKRLFLLLAALFVVTALQAQVMCYEYECRIVNTQYPESHIEGSIQTTPNGGKKVYLVIDKAQNKAHISNAKGEYVDFLGTKMMYLLQTREYRWVVGETSYTTPINFSKLKVEKKSSSGERYSEFYTFIRTMSASEKHSTLEIAKRSLSVPVPQQVHENPTYRPRFLGDTSENSFREWFKREMPAQDSFDRVRRITIVIETDGSVTVDDEDIETGIPQNKQLVQQVTEVLARSPKWTPAYDKDGKTPIRYRMNMYELFLRKTEAWLAREAQKAKEQAEQKAKEEAEREAYLRTPEGKARERQKIEDWCAQWGVGAFDRVICQSRGGAKLGGITVEALTERIRSASRPLVVITEYPACPPSRYLMQDLKTWLEAYEDQYDLYIVHLIPAVEAYQKALGLGMETPSVLFVYNGYGAYEVRVGYGRSEQQKFIAWFDQMMKKASF